jgi:hypothetical protein
MAPRARYFDRWETDVDSGAGRHRVTRGVRVLQHADDIYAMAMAPCYPLNADGTAMNEAAKWKLYFDRLWVSRDTLAGWGFKNPEHYDLNLHSDPQDDLPDVGVEGGGWTDMAHFDSYIFERRLKVGAWSEFLESYCSAQSVLEHYCGVFRTARSSPAATYVSQAAACIAAQGGCSSLTQALATWRTRPTSVLAGSP